MSERKRVSAEDRALFRRAAGTVTPLHDDGVEPARVRKRPAPHRTAQEPVPLSSDPHSDSPWDRELESGEELLFVRPGVQRKLMHKLRRGKIDNQAELDLHGMTAALAHEALERFMQECLAHELRCVRIIHGKGFGSQGRPPVIKAMLDRWLRLSDNVTAFCSARPADGGTGAVYVLLRR